MVLVLTNAGLTLLAAPGGRSVQVGNDTLGGNPAGGLPGLDVEDVHGVDLLKSAALGLVDEEEDNENGKEAAGGKDVAVAEVDGVGDEGGEEGNQEVPGPVGGGSNTHADSAVLEGVHLTTDSPDNRTPGGSEADNEEAGENNHSNTGRVRGGVGVQDLVADGGPDHEADEHPSGTVHQTLAATIVFDDVQTGQGHTEVDGTENDGGDVRVAQTDTLEDTGSVVEDEVGTGQLLQRLQSNAEQDTVQHARAGEDLLPRSIAVGELLLKLLLHVGHLLGNDTVVAGDAVQLAHDIVGLLGTTVTVGETGRLGQEEGTDTKNQGPGEANAHGDAPRGGVLEGLSAEVDNIRDEDTETTNSWKALTIAPRTWRGADSDWYMGTTLERAPTPRPATQRPRAIWYHLSVVAICTMIPTMWVRAQKEMEYLRPIRSAMGAATRAPIIVPMESWNRV